jgi:hypothetical protein
LDLQCRENLKSRIHWKVLSEFSFTLYR